MEKFDELLKTLKELNITQEEMDWAECLPNDIWDAHFKENFKSLATNMDVDTRRHYESSVSVIEIYGKLLGIRHISNLFSESSSCEDCCVDLDFFEMKEVKVTSYEKV